MYLSLSLTPAHTHIAHALAWAQSLTHQSWCV